MRQILLVLALAACSTMAFAAGPRQIVLQVQNMTCPACSITIEKALDNVPGVSAKHVDTTAATVTVTFDGNRTTEVAIARAISEAGFPAAARESAKP